MDEPSDRLRPAIRGDGVRLAALLVLAALCCGCAGGTLPPDPLFAQAAGYVTETAQINATNDQAARVSALYLASTQDAAIATATQAASEWSATQTYRAATVQAAQLTQAVATATVAAYQVERTELARIKRAEADLAIAERQAEATTQAQRREAWTRTANIAGWTLNVLLGAALLAITVIVCLLIVRVGEEKRRQEAGKTSILEAEARQKSLMYSADGTYSWTGQRWAYVSPRGSTPINAAPAAPATDNGHNGRMTQFLQRAIDKAGGTATYIPGHRDMEVGPTYWDEVTGELVRKRLIPTKEWGKSTKLWPNQDLNWVLREARKLEAPSPPPPEDGDSSETGNS